MTKYIIHTVKLFNSFVYCFVSSQDFFFSGSPLGLTKKLLSRQPLSAKAFSSISRRSMKASRANLKSGHSPHGYPPWAQTIFPVAMQSPISQRTPGPLNLCENHFGSNSVGSKIRKSVPSRETNVLVPSGAFSKRFSQSS